MLVVERQNLIIEKLQDEKKVVVSELSQLFNVSEETIRRDLDKLEIAGVATKSYGGATFNENTNIDMPFNVRKKCNVEGKKKIAEIVRTLIEDGDHIILDASTTSVFVSKEIKKKQKLTVITNSLEVMIELSDMPEWDIISTGGLLKEGSLSLVGSSAVASINSFNVEKVIMSCKGIDLEKGITDSNEMFSQIKRAMLNTALIKILAVDSSKFNKTAFSKVRDLREINIIVTDKKPEEIWLEKLVQIGVVCMYPKE